MVVTKGKLSAAVPDSLTSSFYFVKRATKADSTVTIMVTTTPPREKKTRGYHRRRATSRGQTKDIGLPWNPTGFLREGDGGFDGDVHAS